MTKLQKFTDGVKISNDTGQALVFTASPALDYHFYLDYEMTDPENVKGMSASRLKQKVSFGVFRLNNEDEALYEAFSTFIEDYLAITADQATFLQDDIIVFTDDDSDQVILTLTRKEDEITIVFSTKNSIYYPDLRIRTSGGKYQDSLMPLCRLHTELIDISKRNQGRTRKA